MNGFPLGFELVLVDLNVEVVNALASSFAKLPRNLRVSRGYRILIGDILRQGPGSLVSPANSIGIMDGGIDRDYADALPGVEERVRRVIQTEWSGYLPVGEAALVETGDERHPWLVVAPTMTSPTEAPRDHSGILPATLAALRAVIRHNSSEAGSRARIDVLFMPGMGTGVAGLDPRRATRSMSLAYLRAYEQLSGQAAAD